MRILLLLCGLVASAHGSWRSEGVLSSGTQSSFVELSTAHTCAPPEPSFGWCRDKPTEFTTDQECTTVCLPGYFPSVPKLKCLESGFFDPPAFSCLAGPCHVPDIVGQLDNGQKCEEFYGEAGVPSGSNCTVKCAASYYAYPPTVSCSLTKLSDSPQCIKIAGACALPDSFTDNVVGDTSKTPCIRSERLDLHKSCDVTCAEGWQASAASQSKQFSCSPSSVPNSDAPSLTCEGLPCPLPQLGSHVVPTITGGCNGAMLAHAASCSVQCDQGYQPKQPTGSSEYSCHAQQLKPATLQCEVKNCGLPDIEGLLGRSSHASFGKCATTYGSECTASCDIGYQGTDQKWVCDDTANWKGTRPSCTIVQCGELPSLTGMNPDQNGCNTYYGSACKYSPKSGWSGDDVTLTCTVEGNKPTWVADKQANAKQIFCRVNERVENFACVPCQIGFVSIAGVSATEENTNCSACPENTYRSAGYATCQACPDNSESLKGASDISQCKCAPGWTGAVSDTSSCTVCPPNTYKSAAGNVACSACPLDSTSDGKTALTSVAQCKCKAGFTGDLSKDANCTMCPEDSYKSTIGPEQCDACPPHSGTSSVRGARDPEACLCAVGYTGLIKSSGSNCTACPPNFFKPEQGPAACSACPTNSHTEGGANDIIDACKCNDGFTGVIISNKPGGCTPIKCYRSALREDLENTGLESPGDEEVAYGDSVSVRCAGNYHQTGSAGPFSCDGTGSDGFGDPDISGITCDLITCSTDSVKLPDWQMFRTTGTVAHNRTAVVECDPKYFHTGPSSISLLCDGSSSSNWQSTDTSALKCTEIECKVDDLELQPGQNTSVSAGTILKSGATVEVTCKGNYRSKGATGPFTCGKDGFSDFDLTGLQCSLIECQPSDLLPTNENEQRVYSSLSTQKVDHGATVEITCRDGYRATTNVKSISATCTGEGSTGFGAVSASNLACGPSTCDGDKIKLGSNQILFGNQDNMPYGQHAQVVCLSGYKAKSGEGHVSQVRVTCNAEGSDGFGDPDLSALVCEDEDDCSENNLWSNSLVSSEQLQTLAGCSDGYGKTSYNSAVSFCAWFCKIESACTHFFVYDHEDPKYPDRCCTYSGAVQSSGVTAGGSFFSQACASKKPSATPSPTATVNPNWWEAPENLPTSTCPAGRFEAITVGNSCFFVSNGAKTFANAEADCVAQGGNLASIHSVEEQGMLATFQTRCGTDCRPFVGAKKSGDKWVWTDGSPFDFTRWKEGCVDENHDVVAVSGNGADWCGQSASSLQPYVCQIRPTPTPVPNKETTGEGAKGEEDDKNETTMTLTTKNGKPTLDPGCTDQTLQTGKMPSSVTGALTGCSNAFSVSTFDDSKEHCAYLCSIDKSCEFFFVFDENYSLPGRCCLQHEFDADSSLYEVDGSFYKQTCKKQKPEPEIEIYKKYIIEAFDDSARPRRAIQRSGTSSNVVLADYDPTKPSHYFRLVPGVNENDGYVSLQDAVNPNQYLRHKDSELFVQDFEAGSFVADASFWLASGLTHGESQFSLKASNLDAYIYRNDNGFKVGPIPSTNSDAFKRAATLVFEPLLAKVDSYIDRGTRMCRDWDVYDSISGQLSQADCFKACGNGVSACGDTCAADFAGGGDNQCNAVEYSAETGSCKTVSYCVESSGEAGGTTKLFLAAYDIPEPVSRSCTICGQNEVIVKECSANHDRVCACAPGFTGFPGSCSEAACPEFSTRSDDGTKCVCNTGYKGGPFQWREKSYEVGICAVEACPAFSTKSSDASLCQCNEGYVSQNEGSRFSWNSESQSYDGVDKPCLVAQCPDFAGGASCNCVDGYLSSVPNQGQSGVFGTNGWVHTCKAQICPDNASPVSRVGTVSCVCDPGYQGLISWTRNAGWNGKCEPVTCPKNYKELDSGECKCPEGYLGIVRWSETAQGFVPTNGCKVASCPAGSVPTAEGCMCEQLGKCSWNSESSFWDCECSTEKCTIPNSYQPTTDSDCKCRDGFAGTVTFNKDERVYEGSCDRVNCPDFAFGDSCECMDGYAAKGVIAWNAGTGNWGDGKCEKVDCPQNTNDDFHPACPCVSGFRYVDNAVVAWDRVKNEFRGTCEHIPCKLHAGNNPPNCKCEKGFKPNNLQVFGMEYSGSCDPVICPASGSTPNCKCPSGFTGSINWDESTYEWKSACEPSTCTAPSVGSTASGICECPSGYVGDCDWDYDKQEYACNCQQKACPSHSARQEATGLCQCTHYGTLRWHSANREYQGKCDLMPWEQSPTQPLCEATGIGHINTQMVQDTATFDVRGREEFVLLSGAYDIVQPPKFQVQVTAEPWKQSWEDNKCTQEDSHFVVFKDVAFRCGDFNVLFEATPHIMNDNKDGCNHSPVAPKVLVSGTSTAAEFNGVDILPTIDGTSKIEFDGGSLWITNHCKGGCSNRNDASKKIAEIGFFCGEKNSDRDVDVKMVYECGTSGGCKSQVLTQVPVSTNTAALRDGTLGGGLCGGWAPQILGEMQSKHKTCRELKPHPFLGLEACRTKFITKDHNSLFRWWEIFTLTKELKYDAYKWDQDRGANPDNGEPERGIDQARLARMRQLCLTLRQKIDPRPENELDKTNVVDSMLLAVVDNCAEDMYWAMDWNDRTMEDALCQPLNDKVMMEQKDVWCATQKLAEDSTDVSTETIAKDRKACPECTPARNEGSIVRNELSELTNYVAEIRSSLDTINKLSYEKCRSYMTAPKLESLDCSAHAFRNVGSWSCGKPVPPPMATFKDCEDTNEGDTCVATCGPSYTRFSPTLSGSTTCEKIQGSGAKGVDVSMRWSSPSLLCVPCTKCDAHETQTKPCSPTSDSVCECKPGYYRSGNDCEKCPAGTYSDTPGATACKHCTSNVNFASEEGSDQCTPCTRCVGSRAPLTNCTTVQDGTCQCAAGYGADVSGNCKECTGGSYSETPGSPCKTCDSCDETVGEIELQSCSSSKNTKCQCAQGWAGVPGDCNKCLKGLTYSVEPNKEFCSRCTVCNNKDETETTPCDVTTNAVCQCLKPDSKTGESCYDRAYRYQS